MFFLCRKKRSDIIFETLVAYLIRFACDMTLAWSSDVLNHCSLSMETTWRGPDKIFALRDHGPLFWRIVADVVTAPVGFSISPVRCGIVPHLLGSGAGRWPSLLGF